MPEKLDKSQVIGLPEGAAIQFGISPLLSRGFSST